MSQRIALALALTAATACGGMQWDSASGGDAMRDQAMGLFVNEPGVTDAVSGDEGDNTDWRYVDVTDPGRVTIVFSIDSPERLEGAIVSLHDEFGGQLERLMVMKNQPTYSFSRDVKDTPTRFFLKVFTEAGRSVYSVGAKQSFAVVRRPPPPPPPVTVVTAAPEPQPKPQVRRRRRRKVVRPRRPKPTPPKTQAPPPPVRQSVTVSVVRVLPSKDGQSCTLYLRVPPSGLRKGMVGRLYSGGSALDGGRVTVTKGGSRTATARVNLPPGRVVGALKVKF